ncbi:MAG: TerB family tellurite resistance protein [Woeseia sp.]
MLKRIFDQIAGAVSAPDTAESDPDGRARSIRRATGVLMLDVALADKSFEQDELEHLLELAEQHFGLEHEEAADFIDKARSEAQEIVSLHEFTQVLHNTLSEDEKAGIVGMLWEIAYADGQLDKYENSLVLKISDLLYVSRGRVMRLKHDARISRQTYS